MHFVPTRPQPLDQADGLRRLFSGTRLRFVAVASNPHVAFSGVLLERVSTVCAEHGRSVLVVDASETAPAPHELAMLDLAPCIEPLGARMSYLAARGLPLRHVDSRGTTRAFLQRVVDAAPQADTLIVHASAGELSRLFSQRPLRPLLLAADHPASVTHAYAGMKLLAARNGLMSFDLLLAAAPASPRKRRIAEQLAMCADNFVGAVLHDWAAVDPACHIGEPPAPELVRLVHALLDVHEETPANAWHADGSRLHGSAPAMN